MLESPVCRSPAERPARSVEAHGKIVAAIEAPAGDSAALAMDGHLRAIEALMKEQPARAPQ